MYDREGGGGGDDGENDDVVITKYLEDMALNSQYRQGRLDMFSVASPSTYSQGSIDVLFTPESQLAQPTDSGMSVYKFFSPNPLDLTSVLVTCELKITAPTALPADDFSTVGLVNFWPSVAVQEQIFCGDNRGPVSPANQRGPLQRAAVAWVRHFGKASQTNLASNQSAGFDFSTEPTESLLTPYSLTNSEVTEDIQKDMSGGAVLTYQATDLPQIDFFMCIKALPPNQRLELAYQWTTDSLMKCFYPLNCTTTEEVTAAKALIAKLVPAFRIVEIRGSVLQLRQEIQDEINADFNPAASTLSLGLNNWAQGSNRPQLLNPQVLAQSGRGRPFQFKSYSFHVFNQTVGNSINFGPIPLGGKPRRIFVFPMLDSGAYPPWFNPLKVANTVSGIQLYIAGQPYSPDLMRPVQFSSLSYALTKKCLGFMGDTSSCPALSYKRWLNQSNMFVFDLSNTRSDNEVEEPDPATVSLIMEFSNAAGGGAYVVGEYDQSGIINDRHEYMNVLVL